MDLTWDVEIPPNTRVEGAGSKDIVNVRTRLHSVALYDVLASLCPGCVRISLADEYPELSKVRGTMEQQRQVRNAKVGLQSPEISS